MLMILSPKLTRTTLLHHCVRNALEGVSSCCKRGSKFLLSHLLEAVQEPGRWFIFICYDDATFLYFNFFKFIFCAWKKLIKFKFCLRGVRT